MARDRLVVKPTVDNDEVAKMDAALQQQIIEIEAARKKVMSAKGKLGLPELLEKRRWEYGITDGAFSFQPYNDTVIVYQLSRLKGETYDNGLILMTETAKRREQEQTPQGIIVGAGLCALDSLRMNGMDLGHIVLFTRMSPWRIQTDHLAGAWEEVLIFRVGDIVGSVDLMENLRKKDVEVRFDAEKYEHYYHDKSTGADWHPQKDTAFVPERG